MIFGHAFAAVDFINFVPLAARVIENKVGTTLARKFCFARAEFEMLTSRFVCLDARRTRVEVFKRELFRRETLSATLHSRWNVVRAPDLLADVAFEGQCKIRRSVMRSATAYS